MTRSSERLFLESIGAPTLVAIALAILRQWLPFHHPVFSILFLTFRVGCYFSAGYLAFRNVDQSLGTSFQAGLVVFIAEFLLTNSIYFLLVGEPTAAKGVAVAFLLGFLFPGFIGLLGGLFAKHRSSGSQK